MTHICPPLEELLTPQSYSCVRFEGLFYVSLGQYEHLASIHECLSHTVSQMCLEIQVLLKDYFSGLPEDSDSAVAAAFLDALLNDDEGKPRF